MIIDCHIRRLRPKSLKVALDIINDGSSTHTINVNIEDRNGGAVGIVGYLVSNDPLNGNLFPEFDAIFADASLTQGTKMP
jgi:hypothetical protein